MSNATITIDEIQSLVNSLERIRDHLPDLTGAGSQDDVIVRVVDLASVYSSLASISMNITAVVERAINEEMEVTQ